MKDDPVLSPEEAPAPKFSFFQVASTGIIVLMGATTFISWYFIRKQQVNQEGTSPKPAVEQPKEELDRVGKLENRIKTLEEKINRLENRGQEVKTSGNFTRDPDVRVKPDKNPPTKNRAQLEQADHAFAAKAYRDAESSYFHAVFLYPDSSNAYVGMALCALVGKSYSKGWDFLARILRRNPDFLKEAKSPRLYFGSEEEYQKHRKNLELYLESNPMDEDAKLLKAWLDIYEKGGNYGKALASELPDNPDAKILIQQIDSSGK